MRWVETVKQLWYTQFSVAKLLASKQNKLIHLFQIASVSPADIHYEETLSTLRYGKNIYQIIIQLITNMFLKTIFVLTTVS